MKKKKEKMFPAIPPNDYEGTIADWQVWLITHGYIKDGSDTFYGDIMLPESEYIKLLESCEN
jgi:hypothetical protein